MVAIIPSDKSIVADFHSPSRLESIVIFSPDITVRDVMSAVLVDYVERFDIDIVHWEAGPREEDKAEEHPGRPALADIMQLEDANVTAAYYNGRSEDTFAFSNAQMLAYRGKAGRITYDICDCISLRVGSGDLSGDTTPDRIRRVIDSHHALVRALITRFPVLRAHIYRSGNNYAPTPPFADPQHLLYIAHRTDIIQSYDNPDDYWNAWDTVEPLDDNRVLVTRALNIDDELKFKAHVYPRTWELVRHARPKLTEYFSPDLREHDKPYYFGPDDVTSPVGYYPPEQWVEFTAFPPENGHVLPRDIHDFRRWLRQKKMDDGRPLKEIRVTFHKLAVAEREKRPLLDIGCRVFGYNDNGDLVELTQ